MITIYGPIVCEDWGDAVCAVAPRIAEEIRNTTGALHIALNTPGGEVSGLTQIVAAVNQWRRANPKSPLKVRIDGLAASCGALFLLEIPRPATIAAVRGSMIMVHGSSLEFISGGAGALRDAADYLDRIDRRIREDLERFGFDEEQVKEWTAEGRQHWFTAEEALEAGIITAVIKGEPKPLEEELEAPEGLKAVALFYPNHQPKNEEIPMAEDPKNPTAEKVEPTPAETPVEETIEVTPEELAEKVQALEEELAATKAELAEKDAALAKAQEELAGKAQECEQAVAKLKSLTGGLRAPAPAKSATRTFASALNEYRQAHPDKSYDLCFAAVAKAEPALYKNFRNK